jgi:uncharacterized protein (TIGR00725 family)
MRPATFAIPGFAYALDQITPRGLMFSKLMETTMRKIVIGVMGPSEASDSDIKNAFELGRLIASEGWVLLSGGGHTGVMHAVNDGAKSAHGLTIGIIWTDHDKQASRFVDIAIFTGMGSARNNINVLSSDVVIACGMGAGTASEIALAIKANKNVVLLNDDPHANTFFCSLGRSLVHVAGSAEAAIELAKKFLPKSVDG